MIPTQCVALTQWNLRKPEIGSAGAGRRHCGFHVVIHCGMGVTGHLRYSGNHSGNLHLETITFDNRQAPRFAHRGCEPVVRTTGANRPSISAGVRTSSAYLAAYLSMVTHSDCVRIVREPLREPGLAPLAVAAHFMDTRVDTGRSVPRQRPDQTLTSERQGAAIRSSVLLADVSAWPGLASPPAC